MKLTTDQIITLSNILAAAKLGSMAVDDKYKVIRLLRTLREHVVRWQDFVKDAQAQLGKDELEAVAAKELNDAKEVDLIKLPRKGFEALMESNPEWTVAVLELIDEVLCESDTNESKCEE